MSGTKTSSRPGWLTLQARGRQDQCSPAGLGRPYPALPLPSLYEHSPTQPPGRLPETAAVLAVHHFVTAFRQAGPTRRDPSWLTLAPPSLRASEWKETLVNLLMLGTAHFIAMINSTQCHTGAPGTWLNNKCSRLCFLLFEPSRRLNSWGKVFTPVGTESEREVLTVDSRSTVWMLTHRAITPCRHGTEPSSNTGFPAVCRWAGRRTIPSLLCHLLQKH